MSYQNPVGSEVQPIDWTLFSVLVLKPCCVELGLTKFITDALDHELIFLQTREVTATRRQVAAHYTSPDSQLDGLTDSDGQIIDELQRSFIGRNFGIFLVTPCEIAENEDAATRIRKIVNAPNFTECMSVDHTHRGSLGRVIELSNSARDAEREFEIWLSPLGIEIWMPPPV